MTTSSEIIATPAALEAAAARMERETVVAVDLEADSMYHYQEQVCLLQMATPEHSFVIDPFPLDGLDRLRRLFADPGIEKVFHGADYDIRSLYRDFRIEVNGLFDTEVACRFLGYQKTGLEAAIDHYFGIRLDKKYQKKDWSQRPLPGEMLDYAARDTAYLISLADRLKADLSGDERLGWVLEECALLSRVRPPDPVEEPLCYRFKGAGRLDRASLAVLEELLQWRDQIARRWDRPVFKVLGQQPLLRIATTRPCGLEALAGLKILSPKQLRLHGEAIVSAVKRGVERPAGQRPRFPRPPRRSMPSDDAVQRIKRIKRWRDHKAVALGIDPALILNKESLSAVATANPYTPAEFDSIAALKEWQRRAFAGEMLTALGRRP